MLISAIRDEIITETGGDTSDTTLQAVVLSFINNCLRRFPRHISDKAITAVKSGSLSSAATTMTLPSGTTRVRPNGIWYETSDLQRIEIKQLKNREDFNLYYRGNASGAPQYAHIYGTTVEFNRKADQAYTVYFDCYKEIADVVAGDTLALALHHI